jgi:hypothetical protein
MPVKSRRQRNIAVLSLCNFNGAELRFLNFCAIRLFIQM